MTAVLLIGFGSLMFVAVAIHGAVGRIADAIEAQNKHHGIGVVEKPATPEKGTA